MMTIHHGARAALLAMMAATAALPALAQAPDAAVRERQMQRLNPALPAVPAQDRDAAQADDSGVDNARGLLAEARALLVRRRNGAAMEMMERAETRLLTNSVLASQADQPQSSGALSHIAAARRLAGQSDSTGALGELDRAVAALPATRRGPGAVPLPSDVPTRVDQPRHRR